MDDDVTLGFAREWLRKRAARGERCPLCRQFTKVYRRNINSGMARWMIRFYLAGAHDGNFHSHRLTSRGAGDWSLLEHWCLILRNPNMSGHWQLTGPGMSFVHNTLRVPEYAVLYDSNLQGLEGAMVGIEECLGRKFNYLDLMAQRPESGEPS